MDIKWIVALLALVAGAALFLALQPPTLGPQPELIFAQGAANQVAILNPGSGKLSSISVGFLTHGVGTAPDGSKAYVASFGTDEVWVIDLKTKQEIGKINVGGKSHHVAVSPDGRYALITVGSTNSLAVINTNTDTLSVSIPLAEGPTYAAFLPDESKAYVTSMNAGVVSVIDTEQMSVVREIAVGKTPDHLAITPDGRTLYVVNQGQDSVSVIDTASDEVITVIAVGKAPHGVAVVERQGKPLVIVGNRGGTTLSIIDGQTQAVVGTFDLKASPEHLTASTDRKYLYVGSIPAKGLFVFEADRQRVVKRIAVGEEIHQIAVIGDLLLQQSKAE